MTQVASGRRRFDTLLASLVVLAAACGGSSSTGIGLDAGATVTLPNVVVRDVAAGADVRLADLLPAPRPILLWFWAPH